MKGEEDQEEASEEIENPPISQGRTLHLTLYNSLLLLMLSILMFMTGGYSVASFLEQASIQLFFIAGELRIFKEIQRDIHF